MRIIEFCAKWGIIDGFGNEERYWHGYYGVKIVMLYYIVKDIPKAANDLALSVKSVITKATTTSKVEFLRLFEFNLRKKLFAKITEKPWFRNMASKARKAMVSDVESGRLNYNILKRIDEGGLGKAYEVLSSDNAYSGIVDNLTKVENHLAKNIHLADELETSFKAAADKAKWIDDIGFNVLRKADGKIEYINPNNKIIKWTSQDPNNFPSQINSAINSGDVGRIAEGQAAQAVLDQKPLEGFGLERKLNGQPAAELDIITADEIIEVKANISLAKDKFPSQIPKFKDSSIDKYVNPRGKPVILYVKEPLPINPNTGTIYLSDQQFIDDLLNNHNIQFSNSLSELVTKLQ